VNPSLELCAVIAPNGLGHARRTLGLLARYLERGGAAQVTIVASPWQRAGAARWPSTRVLEQAGATWVHDVTEPGVAWSRDPATYADGRLLAWEDRAASVGPLLEADLVLSDNLVGILSARPDAVLAGSFLWSDVLEVAHPDVAAVREFATHERALLDAHRPPMLCVADLAMPGVLERTAAEPVGWMCQDDPRSPRADEQVAASALVLGGATGAADDILREAAEALVRAGVVVRTGVADVAGAQGFDGSPAAWTGASVAVCRPGAGTLTDAVAHGVPMVCLHEGDNLELAHNGRRIAELGYGSDLGARPDAGAVVEAVQALVDGPDRALALDHLAGADRNGLDEAADRLAVHSGARLRPGGDGRPRPDGGKAT
jgi:hypothetical protein